MPQLLCILGPTASGKSSLAIEVCARVGGEIVSCDSMQIYRGCDIATAKPTRAEREKIPHHLLDICNPSERFSAAQWASQARRVIAEIEARGRIAVVCGGTGFWLRALLFPDFLSDVAPDSALKRALETQLQEQGAAQMHAQLAKIDAGAAQRLHPNDSFRVLRALEIALLRTSEAAAEFATENAPEVAAKSAALAAIAAPFEARIFGLQRPRDELYARIDSRVSAMLAAGALDELQQLREIWGDDAPALGGVGYKQMLPVLRGETELKAGVEAWQRDSRRYAKRQMTWLRHQLPLRWLDGSRETGNLADEIAGEMR